MVKNTRNVILTCAVTGGIHTPTMTPHLPVTPDQIVSEATMAAEAGAAIIHLHARDPETGAPTADPAIFEQFLGRIKQQSNAVINITTGGSVNMSFEDRLAAARAAKPELCSLNMGSMNFGIFPVAEKYQEWKYSWEKDFVLNTKSVVVSNSFAQIETIIEELGKGAGTRFECECYDVGHLYNLAYFLDAGIIEPPLFVQTIFGILGGIGADIENMVHMKNTADRLFGNDYEWSVLAAGRHQMRLATAGVTMGANVRVGLEDSIYIGRGTLARSNAEQVSKIKNIILELSGKIATPDEVRVRLGLKGGDNVNF